MKRKFLVVLLAIVATFCMAFGLAACGEKSDETGNETGSNPSITDPSDGEQGGTQKPDEGGQGGTQKPDESEQGGTQKPDDGEQEPETYTEGLCFTEMYGEDGTTVIGYSVGAGEAADEEEIIIPSEYNNLPVLSISRSQDDEEFWKKLYEVSGGLTEAEQFVLSQKYTFSYCVNLKKITIPDSVTVIGNAAFGACSALTEINIPDGVTSIGDSAFYDCIGLTSITIPHSMTLIRNRAFEGCYKLVEVWNYSDLQIEEDSGYNGGVGEYALNIYTTNEKSKQTKTDDGYLFYEDGEESYLLGYIGTSTELTLPAKSPTGKNYEIYQYAFYYCNKLTSVTIPDSVTLIGDEAFYWCSGLTSITIGRGVKEIGGGAFAGCFKLMEVWNYSELQIEVGSYFANGSIGEYAFIIYTTNEKSKQTKTNDGYLFYEDGTESYLLGYYGASTELTLPAKSPQGNNYEIYQSAFYYCNTLTSVTIPDSVTSIGSYAFRDCSGLTSVTIGKGVIEIEYAAFGSCTALKEVHFENPNGWKVLSIYYGNGTTYYGTTTVSGLEDPATAAQYLTDTYCYYDCWKREG